MRNHVELIGFYGGDYEHAMSAWTSTSRQMSDDKVMRIPKLLKMLAENGHETPFEKSMIHFLVTVDTATHIQLIKHRIGVSINAESARYKELKDDKYYKPPDWPGWALFELEEHMIDSYNAYHYVLDRLVTEGMDKKRAKESARFFLPYANQVSMDISFNFRSFVHFQKLRNKPDAQLEIKELAAEMLRLVKDTGAFNESIKAFKLGDNVDDTTS